MWGLVRRELEEERWMVSWSCECGSRGGMVACGMVDDDGCWMVLT